MGENKKQTNNQFQGEEALLSGQFDLLTGLQNMTGFFEYIPVIRKEIRESGSCPVFLFLNLSGMKYYNRRNSFADGDFLLREFADLLKEIFGERFCFRYGQDHFGVLTEEEGLDEKLNRMISSARNLNDGKSLPVRVGVYRDTDETVDFNTISDRAKIACDEIGDIYVSTVKYFDASMVDDEEKQRHIIDNIDRAIEEGWIEAYYQPIVRAVNGKVCDEEALARWIDPVYGFLSPADFIPVLEEARLIYKLDLCVLDLVIRKQLDQKAAGFQVVPSSVNLSRADFDSCDIVEEIRKRVDEAGISRKNITIEITESIIGSDFEFMKEQVGRFRDLGFPVWMDDFGSGYSALDVLQHIRFDLIKFDMHFMKQLDEGGSGKIILTEMIKMVTSLGVDMVCEGVETEEQVLFLQEIGCSKLQGYYYEKPIPLTEVFKRYKKGMRIGFENPDESEYYDNIGRINLYDLAVVASGDESSFQNFFDTLPMAIIEYKDGAIRLVRSNRSYRDFLVRAFRGIPTDSIGEFSDQPFGVGSSFMELLHNCCESGNRVFVDDHVSEDVVVHSFARMITKNPVTQTYAVAIVILSVTDVSNETTYESIAKALAQDYFNIFYVNLDTEDFIEYTSSVGGNELTTERHGEDFFRLARADARRLIHKDDQEKFIAAFTKENVVRALDEQGSFTINYRLNQEDHPFHVLMKATRMKHEGNFIIIGVSNIDIQMRQREEMERIRREQQSMARIMALSGEYLAIYLVDLKTEYYTEFSSADSYKELGLTREGEGFFADAARQGELVVAPEDLPAYRRFFNKEKILEGIEKNGIYVLRYHLILDGEKKLVSVRAALLEENDGLKLIFGVNKLYEQINLEE